MEKCILKLFKNQITILNVHFSYPFLFIFLHVYMRVYIKYPQLFRSYHQVLDEDQSWLNIKKERIRVRHPKEKLISLKRIIISYITRFNLNLILYTKTN